MRLSIFHFAFSIATVAAAAATAAPLRLDVEPGVSLATVRDRVRALTAAERADGVEVVLAPGEYVLPNGLDFGPEDGGASADAPVVWRAATPGTAQIVGARPISPKSLHLMDDPALLARLPEEGRGKVWTAPLSGHGHPARDTGKTAVPGGDSAGKMPALPELPDVFEGAPPPMVFFDGIPGRLAAWPNGDEWATFTDRVDRGTPVQSGDHTLWRGGAFVWSHPRAARWDFASGIWLNGYFTHDWRNCTARVGSYGSENGTNDVMRLAGDIPYGVLGGTWGRKERRFKAVNLFEELDEPLEWWIDRERGVLYFVPPEGVSPAMESARSTPPCPSGASPLSEGGKTGDVPPGHIPSKGDNGGHKPPSDKGTRSAPLDPPPSERGVARSAGGSTPYVAETPEMSIRVAFSSKPLLRGTGVSNLLFEGISFACNHGPFVAFDSPRGVAFRDCRFIGTASDAIILSGDARDMTVERCEVAHCGAGGIRLSGGDRRSLTPSGSAIENCRIHDFGIFRRTYAGGVRLEGCGHVLRGCEIWDAPHTAVFWEGNDMLLESNDVHHVLLETGDAGAFYTGRDWTTQGNVLRGNFVHDIGGGTTAAEGADAAVSGTNAMGFYFDDCDCGDEVVGNRFLNVPRAIMVGGGRDHPIRGNTFENCRLAISIDCRGITWGDKWKAPSGGNLLEEKAIALDYKCGVWAERYPRLARILDDHPGEPLHNPIEDNVFIHCGNVLAIGEAFRLDRDGMAPGLASRLAPIRDNVVIDPPDGPPAHIAPDVAAGFRRHRP